MKTHSLKTLAVAMLIGACTPAETTQRPTAVTPRTSPAAGLSIDTYTAPEEGAVVNSFLIQSDKELVVVDGQLTVPAAQGLIAKIKATKKAPKAFVLTHAHPDHYFGFHELQKAYPDVKLYATAGVREDYAKTAAGTLEGLKGVLGAAAPTGLATLTPYTKALELGGHTIELSEVTGGEHTVSSYVRIPSMKAILAGDTLYDQVHLYMKGCDADTWLTQIQSWKNSDTGLTYYPGHGAGKGGVELLDANIAYIQGFSAEVAAATGTTIEEVVADARARVIKKFPGYKAPQLIDYGLTDYVKCSHPIAKSSAQPAASATLSSLSINGYTAPEEGAMVNSFLIESDKELIVVDGQLTVPAAQGLLEKIKATKKTPKAFVLTHAHPDHYFGFHELQKAYPNVKLYASAGVKDDYVKSAPGTLEALKGTFGDAAPKGLMPITAYTEPFELGGHKVEVVEIKGGEHSVSCYVNVPSLKAVIAGDSLYDRVHLYMKGCDTETWLAQLKYKKSIVGTGLTFYPGHGAGKGGIELVDANIAYIQGFKEEVAMATGTTVTEVVDDARKRLLAKFPDYKAPQLIDYGLTDYVNCTHPIAGKN